MIRTIPTIRAYRRKAHVAVTSTGMTPDNPWHQKAVNASIYMYREALQDAIREGFLTQEQAGKILAKEIHDREP